MLTPTEKKQLSRFEKNLAIPAWKYFLVNGVLGWGIPVALLFALFQILVGANTLNDMFSKVIWLNLPGFCLGGIVWAFWMRGFASKQVNKLREKESSPD